LDNIVYMLDLAGVAVFAISGAIAAGRKSLDVLGVIVIAAVTAIGGGTLRDVLLDRYPIFWINDPTYLIVACGAALLTVIYARFLPLPNHSLLIADALGLAFFTILGTGVAERAGLSPIIVVLMATMTGVAGGMIRDVLCAEVPLILRRDIYATAAIVGACLYLVVRAFDFSSLLAGIAGIVAVVLLRILAIFRGLRLPVFRVPEGD